MTVWTPGVKGQKAQTGMGLSFLSDPEVSSRDSLLPESKTRLAVEFLYSYRRVGRSGRPRRETEGRNKSL